MVNNETNKKKAPENISNRVKLAYRDEEKHKNPVERYS